MEDQPRRRRLGRVIGRTAIALAALACLAIAAAAVAWNGPRLGRMVSSRLREVDMAGRVGADAIHWRARALVDFLLDTPTPVVVEGLRFVDPDGVEVLWVPRVEARIRPRSAIDGRVILSDVVVSKGARWRFAQLKGRREIGFLATFFSRQELLGPVPPPPSTDPGAFVLRLDDVRLDGLDVTFDFPDVWGLALRGLHTTRTRAALRVEDGFVGWSASALEAPGGGYLEVLGERLPWDRVKVRKVATTSARPDDIFLDLESATTGPSRLWARGYFTGIYGYGTPPEALPPPAGIDLHAEIADAAAAVRATLARHDIPALTVGGAALVKVDLRGTFEEMKLAAELRGLDLAHADRPVRDLAARFTLDLAEPVSAAVESLSFAGGSGGRFELDGRVRGPAVSARLRFDQFGTLAYLPPAARDALGGRLQGRVVVAADLARPALGLDEVDLRLERAARRAGRGRPVARAATHLRLRGRARATPDAASTEGLTFELPGATVTARGRYGLAHQVLGFGLRVTAAQLPRLLASFGLPPVAEAATLELDVGGQLMNPRAKGSFRVTGLTVPGLPPIDTVDARVSLEGGQARLDALRSEAFGGVIEASGDVRLWDRSVLRPLRAPPLEVRAFGRGLDLDRLVAGGALAGRLDVRAEATGTPRAFRARVTVPAGSAFSIYGEPWRVVGCELDADAERLYIRSARLERAGGGSIEVRGQAGFSGPVALAIDVEGVPLEGLPGLGQRDVAVEGRLSSHLAISGTLARPLVAGDVRLTKVSLRGVALGDARLQLRPTEDGGVAASGDLFGRMTVGGWVSYGPGGPMITARGQFRNVLLEQFLPELAAFGDARGRLTGTVDLSYGGANPLKVDLRMTELELSAARDIGAAAGSATGRLAVRNATPVRVILAGQHLVVDRARFVTEGGDLRVWGEIKEDAVNAELTGVLDLELLRAVLGSRVDSVGGEIDLALRVRGTPRHPQGEGSINITRPVAVRLPSIAPTIRIPTGAIKVDAGALSLNNLVVEAEGAQLRLGGRARFGPRQKVEALDFAATGDLSGALLEALGGGAFADAAGRARLDARVEGTGAAPKVRARLDLTSLAFRPRDLGREVAFESGIVELTDQEVTIRDLRARVDGEGEFLLGVAPEPHGRIALRGTWPTPGIGAVRLPVRGQKLSLRVSNAVELDDVGLDVDVRGDVDRGFTLDGEITVASGRYVQDFNVQELVITPSIDESEVQPFYAGNPLLERLKLHLRLRTLGDTFVVQNNLIPELHLVFDLLVQGTLAQPRIAGEVRPTDGQIHLFGVRENFELVPNVNRITFVETKSIDRGETPEINLEAEALITDINQRDHLVRMTITGPIGRAHIDLSTNTGLNRSQALLLLVSRRTGDTDGMVTGAAGATTTAGSIGSGGPDVIGQLFGDILEPIIDDKLYGLTRGKINLRPTLGPEGLELRVDARVSRQFDLHLSYLRGLETRSQLRAESRLWLMDYITLRGLGEQMTYSPQQGLVEDARSLKLELSMDFPIRLFLR